MAMIKAVQKTLRFVKISLVLTYLCFSVLYILLVLPTSRAHFVQPIYLFFYLLVAVNMVLTLLVCIEELLMLSSLTVALSIISIITSYIIIDHNLIISLCLLVIFFMTFMLTLVLYVKPKVLVDQALDPSECANDDQQLGQEFPNGLPQAPAPNAVSCTALAPVSLFQPSPHQQISPNHHLLQPQGQPIDQQSLEQAHKRQFYLNLWRMKAVKVCLEQSLNLDSSKHQEDEDHLQSPNAYKTILSCGSSGDKVPDRARSAPKCYPSCQQPTDRPEPYCTIIGLESPIDK